MEINLVTVSRVCAEIICQNRIQLHQLDVPDLREFYQRVHEIHPKISEHEDYVAYWRCGVDDFMKIYDYLSYATALNLLADGRLYIILNDCATRCVSYQIMEYLMRLDEAEAVDARDSVRDKYDVTITKKGQMDDEIARTVDEMIRENIPPEVADDRALSDSQVLTFALRKTQPSKYFTKDLMFSANLIRDAKRGYPDPKLKKSLLPPVDEIFAKKSGAAKSKEKKNKDKKKKDKGGGGGKKDKNKKKKK